MPPRTAVTRVKRNGAPDLPTPNGTPEPCAFTTALKAKAPSAVLKRAVLREKRQHLRAQFTGAVTVQGAYEIQTEARDISVGGMFLNLPEGSPSPKIGAEVTLTFTLPGLPTVQVPGFVRWIQEDGFGVQFGLLGPRVTHAIGKLTLQSA
jgi:PilZ domain